MKKEVMILTGAGQIGMAIARRMGAGMKIVIGDKKMENAQTIAQIMNEAGFDTVPVEMDLSSHGSILNIIAKAREYGEISMLVNAAGVSPSHNSSKRIFQRDGAHQNMEVSHDPADLVAVRLTPLRTS